MVNLAEVTHLDLALDIFFNYRPPKVFREMSMSGGTFLYDLSCHVLIA